MKSGIYKITSPTGRIYIGQSKNTDVRISHYKQMSCKRQLRIYRSLKKHGPETHIFETIEVCDIDHLNERERFWQEYYNCIGGNGLNCVLVNTSTKKQVFTDDVKRRISESNKGKPKSKEHVAAFVKTRIKNYKKENHWNYGGGMSDHVKSKLSLAVKGRKRTPEEIEKSASKIRGIPRPIHIIEELKKRTGSNNPMFGKKIKESSKDLQREKLSGSKNYLYKPILNLETGIYYDTLKEAADTIGIDRRKLWENLAKLKVNKTKFIYP